MPEICLFAGTAEGRRLTAFLEKQDVKLTVCVASEYGGQLLDETGNFSLSDRKLSAEEIFELLRSGHFDLVIDATHPYASAVTENIAEGCRKTGTEYLRLLRGTSRSAGSAVTVPDIASAVEFLNTTEGNILLTTGSKNLGEFAALRDFPERVYARVLPMKASLEACDAAGLKPSHIIAMQGPFSEDMNLAVLRSVRAAWLVTKDTGETGGFDAKVTAAEKAGAGLVVIGRPSHEDGFSEAEIIEQLCGRFGFSRVPRVTIIGIGPGGQDQMTRAAWESIGAADCLIGAKRMLAAAVPGQRPCFEAISPDAIAEHIRSHPEYRSFAVLMSGDSGFYSGTRRLLPLLKDCETEVLPGISSLSYLCAKLQTDYEEIRTLSLHGRTNDFLPVVRQEKRLFLLTGGENTVDAVCRKLIDAGLDDVFLSIGEHLSYPDEQVRKGTPRELLDGTYDPLSVILIENNNPSVVVTHGLPDEAFERESGSKGLIPMTKSEIRSVCLSKLALTENAVCWDIGCGTGSVSVEMALQAKKGHVYAVDIDPAAVELTGKNAARFSCANLSVTLGPAPESCRDLPTPTHVFIGGSSGNLKEIILALFEREAPMRITAAAVTLDTITELTDITGSFPFSGSEVVMIQTSRGKQAGSHRLMLGGNPVYIFTMNIAGKEQ
ncbi:MAG: precorrin-6A reductase [Flexilinea sp.]|nr:precorrin-6A reductase [Flexilinea sp.]